ncbi:MAG: aldo/keto reductase [Planctomycetes bacterium]|nr:aldo/keto reductase [Planctomycetota bacterium]
MDYTTLGRTGLRVSRMGLGCGGPSRLGLNDGKSEQNAEAVVRRAMELCVNFFDTAEVYRTEEIVGRALGGVDRDKFVISTKKPVVHDGELIDPNDFAVGLEGSLRRLGMDYVDIYNLHGVRPEHYDHARERIWPVMEKLRDQGKCRFLGITEIFIADPTHRMLSTAVRDGCWDVVMVGFNLLNPSARRTIFPTTRSKGIGTLIMFPVRRALSRPGRLREVLDELQARGEIGGDLPGDDPLGFLSMGPGAAKSLTEAAYRFCRHEPGADVILSGTGNIEHLEANVKALNLPPLRQEDLERLEQLFGLVESITGE